MFSIWFVGFLLIIAYRIFNAGRMPHKLFYRVSPFYGDNGAMIIDEGKVFSYIGLSFVMAIFWMAVLPVIGIYMLGKHFQKES